MPSRPLPSFVFAGLALVALVALAYSPGLAGGFLFDDFPNLRTLGSFGAVDDGLTLLYYLTSGIADPTGRPVSMASFLLDARNWPADPAPFKRTNLILHLVNAALIGCVVLRLERHLGSVTPARAGWIALLAAALWAAHPLFVSTTLYVVQRHAMLAMTFVLLALLAWDRVVRLHAQERHRAAHITAVLALGTCYILAGLSKANGMLAPLLALCAAWTVYAARLPSPGAANARRWTIAFALVMPALLVLLAILAMAPGSLDSTAGRSFTLGERLLTQPRALVSYIGQLVIPRSGGGGVFVEQFAKSEGLFAPWSTLPAALAILALAGWAIRQRKRHPRFAFAALFFLCGHLMESSVIMLELYFEHRNYLPAAFLGWPLARWLIDGQSLPALRRALTPLLVGVLLMLTWQRATVWGDPALLAAVSAQHNPQSMRAQVVAAAETAGALGPAESAARIREMIRDSRPTTTLAFNLIAHECASGGLAADTLGLAKSAIAAERAWHSGVASWFRNALSTARDGHCRGLDLGAVGELLAAAAENPLSTRGLARAQSLAFLKGLHALYAGDLAAADLRFDESLRIRPNPDIALWQAAVLGEAGHPALALAQLERFGSIPPPQLGKVRNMQGLHRWLLHATGYYAREFENLRRALEEPSTTPSDHPIGTPPPGLPVSR